MGLLPFEQVKREVLVKREADTNPKFGCNPFERKISDLINFGVINLNKSKGPTSHMVSAYVQKILQIDKAGHGGSLDPGVTGILPVALCNATRVVQALLTAGKEYVCIMHLHDDVERAELEKALKEFTGKIMQMPPVKSAVVRKEREREVYYLDILEIDGKDVLFKMGSQAGTYVRKLCLHPDTEILSKKGVITASDFYSSPETVYSFKKGRIVEKNPSKTQKFRSPKKLIRITTSSGIDFTVTPDHKLLKSTDTGYEMVEAENLKEGNYLVKSMVFPNIGKEYVISDLLDDRFLIQQQEIKRECKKAFIKKYSSIRGMYRNLKIDRKAFLEKSKNAITIKHLKLAGIYDKVKRKIRIFKTEKGRIIKISKLNKNLFYLLGLIASDGNNTKEKNTIRYTRLKFHNKNETLVNEFLRIYKKSFPSISISKKNLKGGIFQLDTSNGLFATIAASLGIRSPYKTTDFLPILSAKPECIKAFLRGYFDGDGTCYFKKKESEKGHYTDIRLFSVNYMSTKRIHQMLLSLNIPNKIFHRPDYYIVAVESPAAKKKFIKEIGTNHPLKKNILIKINDLYNDDAIDDHLLVGLHLKEEIKKRKKCLYKMGGNLSRILKGRYPMTRRFYKRCSTMTDLPSLDEFIIEKIASIKHIKGSNYVYDMTVPETHNFLIETGFVSSNCHDVGKRLKVGAHMAELIRTKAGPFTENDWVTLQDLEDAFVFWKDGNEKFLRYCVKPVEFAVQHLAKVWVQDSAVDTICHGASLNVPGIVKIESGIDKDDDVAVLTLKGELVALGTAVMTTEQVMTEQKGFAVRISKVFMLPGTYPKEK